MYYLRVLLPETIDARENWMINLNSLFVSVAGSAVYVSSDSSIVSLSLAINKNSFAQI